MRHQPALIDRLGMTVVLMLTLTAAEVCAQGETGDLAGRLIATVGPETITAREVISAAEQLFLEEPSGDPLTDRRRLIEPLIQAKLLVAEGKARGFETPVMRRNLLRYENDYLVNELENTEIRQRITIDGRALEEAVERQKVNLHLRHIVTAEQEEALAVLEQLKQGGDFATLASDLSIDLESGSRGGELPPMTWNIKETGFINFAYSLGPGEVGGPVPTDTGWHVIRLDSISTRDVDEVHLFEEAEKTLMQITFSRRQLEFLEEMKVELHYTISDSVLWVFVDHMQAWVADGAQDLGDPGGTVDRFGFSDEQRDLVVFTYDGGEFTIADYSLMMATSATNMVSMRVTRERALRDLVQYFRNRAYGDVARARGYLEATGFGYEVQRQREKGIIQEMHKVLAPDRPPLEEEVLAHFTSQRDRYQGEPRIVVTEIVTTEDETAQVLERALKGGMSADAALATVGGRGDEAPEVRSRLDISRDQVAVAAVSELAGGEFAAIEEDGRHRILIVESNEPAQPLSFEEARSKVQRDLVLKWTEAKYDALIEELRQKYPIEIRDEELLRLPL